MQEQVYARDLDMNIIYINPASEKLTGWTLKDALGQKCYDIFGDEKQICKDVCPIEKMITEKMPIYHHEGKLKTRYGDEKDMQVSISPLLENDSVTGAVVVMNDITHQKEIKQTNVKNFISLSQEKQKSDGFINIAGVMLLIIDTDENITLMNKKGYEILGYNKGELIGKNWFDTFVPGKTRKELKGVFQRLVSGDIKPVEYHENQLLTKDGKEITVVFHNTILRDSEGNITGTLSSGEDITERKLAENALRESEEKYRLLAQSMNDVIVQLSPIGELLYVSPNVKEFGGYDPESEIGKDMSKYFANDTDIIQAVELLEKISETHQNGNFEFLFKPKDKKSFPVEHTYFPIVKDNKVTAIQIVLRDITERKQAEVALQESEEKYRSMMESMKNASYICSSELKIEYINPAMIDRIGKDATGELCYKAIYDRDGKCSWCVLDQINKGEKVDYEVVDPKDNHYYSVANSPIFHVDGNISKLTIFHDITEIKNIEAQLQQSRKMESIGTLTGGIAHDFNNLLFMISGNTEIALDDTPDWNPVHQNLQEIKTASLKAAGIVKQLLHFSRKTDQQLKPIGAVTVIKDSIKFLRSTIPSNIKIQTQFPDTEIPILADSIQINQIMMNICINASHAMEETGGTLKINIETSSLDKEAVNNYPDLTIADNYLKVTLSDTGPGIPSETINRIFDPYFTTKKFGKGSGMGLTVVQGIVKNHNGAITVNSEVGKGVAFTILFPVVDESPEIITNETATLPHGTETILFVDDEKTITNMMQQMLEKLGYQVEAKLNPEEALDLFQSKPDSFDIVITDMTMPQMTGAKFAKKLKEIRSDIPIILCTGHSSLIDEDKARQYGISGYLMKPVSKSKIAKAIQEALDK